MDDVISVLIESYFPFIIRNVSVYLHLKLHPQYYFNNQLNYIHLVVLFLFFFVLSIVSLYHQYQYFFPHITHKFIEFHCLSRNNIESVGMLSLSSRPPPQLRSTVYSVFAREQKHTILQFHDSSILLLFLMYLFFHLMLQFTNFCF